MDKEIKRRRPSIFEKMNVIYRPINKDDQSEMRLVAEADARIPLEFDPEYAFSEASIDHRLDYFKKQLTSEDFVEVAEFNNTVVGFHIVKKLPYLPDFYIASIITLWVRPDFRHQGIAARLKSRAEEWARTGGMKFMQTNVHKNNARMLKLNQSNGYETAYINMRKML